MARSIQINGWNIPVRLEDYNFAEAARNGEVATGGLTLDSENAGVDVNGHWEVSARETDAPAPHYLFEGYLADKTIERGPWTIDRDRHFNQNLVDLNTLLIDDVMTGSPANRPEETDVERVTWLVGSSFLFGMGGNIGAAGATTLEAHNYATQTPLQLLTEAAETAGKLFFVYWDFATEAPKLFYDLATSSNFITSSKISTLLADSSNSLTHHARKESMNRQLDYGRIYSELLFKYDGGGVTVVNSATASNYRPRKTVIYDNTVKTAAHATRKANQYLNSVSTPEDVITLDVDLTSAQINEFRAGQMMQIKAPHLGLPNFVDRRIVRTERKPRGDGDRVDQQDYRVTMELSVPKSNHFGSRGVPTEALPDDTGGVTPTPTEPADTVVGNCTTTFRSWLRRGPDGFQGVLGGLIMLYVGSHVSDNIAWSVSACPIGGGAWVGYEDRESWYEFTAPADDASYLGLMATVDATSAWTSGTVGAYSVGIYPGTVAEGLYGMATMVAGGGLGDIREIYIPRNLVNWGGVNSIVLHPDWECARSFFTCNEAAYFDKPLNDGRGGSGGYYDILVPEVCTVAFASDQENMLSGEVAAYGATDGVNRDFLLINWDGTGTPEVSLNGLEQASVGVVFNRSTRIATLETAPPENSVLLWDYNVGPLVGDIELIPGPVAISIRAPDALIAPAIDLLPDPVGIGIAVPEPFVDIV